MSISLVIQLCPFHEGISWRSESRRFRACARRRPLLLVSPFPLHRCLVRRPLLERQALPSSRSYLGLEHFGDRSAQSVRQSLRQLGKERRSSFRSFLGIVESLVF